MTRTHPKHGDFEDLGTQLRQAEGLAVDPRTTPQNVARMRNKLQTHAALAQRNPAEALTDQDIVDYLQQFITLSDNIRTAVRGTVPAGGGLRTPLEIHDGQLAEGYLLVEWRIKTINPNPPANGNGCGCGCGCGCGG